MKRIILALALSLPLAARCERKTPDVWLTPERARQLRGIADRPTVVRRERLDDERAEYHWNNGSVTTQRVERIVGRKSRDARRERLEAAERRTDGILKELEALKEKPTKAALEALLKRNRRGGQ